MPNGLQNLDLNLLSALVVLVEERSTTKAARRLNLAQSTVSGMLSKLRDVFEDELLVREGRDFVPTARALELVATAKPHLDALLAAIGEVVSFDPAVDGVTFRLGCTDAVGLSILQELTATLRAEAPHCKLVVRIGDYLTLPGMLLSGEAGVVLGYLRDDPHATAKQRVVRHAPWVVLRDNQSAPVATLEDFCSRSHALVTPLGDLDGFIDAKLAEMGHSRTVTTGLSSFALILGALPGSDLLTTVPDFVAEKLALWGGLTIEPCPVDLSPVTNSMAWSAAMDRDPAQKWFREKVAAAFLRSVPSNSQ